MQHLLTLATATALLLLLGCGDTGTGATGGPVAMRRLTAEQYRNTIEDTFGSAVEVAGRFEPDSRREGLNALGASLVAVTPSGFEQYETLARGIAAQVTAPELRAQILPCQPQAPDTADNACTEQVIREVGRMLLRRPLAEEDVKLRVDAAARTATAQRDFYAGLQLALTSLLVAPEFLFRVEVAEPAPLPGQPDRLQLSDLSLATRLSYFLWNRGPDEALLAAAERGELTRPEGLAREVDRMLASKHLAAGVRAFFEDVFSFDKFDDLGKDVTRYPLFNNHLAADAREQTLRFVVDQLVTQQADYRSLFTSRQLPMTRSLGPLYGIPVRSVEGWEDATLPANQPRAGLLSHASFAMLFSHPGRSSPTLRGVFMREALLCQPIPEAPADVDFTQFVQDVATVHQTARDRLQVHSTQVSCNACHILTDPIGLGLENFDGIGRFRTVENEAAIDTSGKFDGKSFADAAQLGQAFADNPQLSACLVQNLYRYAVGRPQSNGERPLLRHLEAVFAENGYQVPALMRDIATSEAFRTATAPATTAGASPEAPVPDKTAPDKTAASTDARPENAIPRSEST
jgi:Protein of unknown function (DUF1592)/Protein of unknown function (DUF1588)/Protein of unknown function (DUF1585)/Protein of unknown function (DUF1587)/Protein of unknown function (DUF1595)